jgi:hypothetical protein
MIFDDAQVSNGMLMIDAFWKILSATFLGSI